MKTKGIVLAFILTVGFGLPATTDAADPANFYRDKTVRLIVGSGVGGGYDSFARATVRHLRLPGDPTIIVQNMPGASGLTAANYLYNIAAKDGTVIGVINRFMVVQGVIGNESAKFDSTKFIWLGTPAAFDADPYLVIVRSSSSLKTVQDIRAASNPLIVGNSGTDVPRILRPALDMNVKVIEYGVKTYVDIALERGEVDAMGITYANLRRRHQKWIDEGTVHPILQFLDKRSPALPDVPTASEFVSKPEQRALLNFIQIPLTIGYPFALPPGLPADRVAVIRKAFDTVYADPAYKEDVLKQGLAYSPKSGDEIEKNVAAIAAAPKSAMEIYKRVGGLGGE